LTVYIQNVAYLRSLNPRLTILPHFSCNSNNFKYHDTSYNNSFFLYFKSKTEINLKDHKIYFCHSIPQHNYIFFQDILPPLSDETNKRYIEQFRSQFELRLNTSQIDQYFSKIRSNGFPLIGIHMRSLAQKKIHYGNKIFLSVYDQLGQIKEQLDKQYSNYNVFIATDVSMYIEYASKVFKNIYYLDFISRVPNEVDSIPHLSQYTGFKLGSDILYDCYALSKCDSCYLSNSNIPFIVNMIDTEVKIITF